MKPTARSPWHVSALIFGPALHLHSFTNKVLSLAVWQLSRLKSCKLLGNESNRVSVSERCSSLFDCVWLGRKAYCSYLKTPFCLKDVEVCSLDFRILVDRPVKLLVSVWSLWCCDICNLEAQSIAWFSVLWAELRWIEKLQVYFQSKYLEYSTPNFQVT